MFVSFVIIKTFVSFDSCLNGFLFWPTSALRPPMLDSVAKTTPYYFGLAGHGHQLVRLGGFERKQLRSSLLLDARPCLEFVSK